MKKNKVLMVLSVIASVVFAGAIILLTIQQVRLLREEKSEEGIIEEFRGNTYMTVFGEEASTETEPPVITAAPTESLAPEVTLGVGPEGELAESMGKTEGSKLHWYDYTSLQKELPDLCAWIEIPGAPIDYPVMYAEDSDKYLERNVYGQKSSLGSIFTLTKLNEEQTYSNIVLYGHNMGFGKTTMFSSLVKYKKKSYAKDHAELRFTFLTKTYTYRLVAAFNIDVEDEFSYERVAFGGDYDFEQYLAEIKERSLYDNDVSVDKTSQLLTLSTCDRTYGGKTGRMVVIFVKVD